MCKYIFDNLGVLSGALLRIRGNKKVYQLDARINDPLKGVKEFLFDLIGLRVVEAEFFIGDLRNASGGALHSECVALASHACLKFSRDGIARNNLLARVSQMVSEDVISLYLARRIYSRVERQVMQIKAAESLAEPGGPAILYLRRHGHYDPIDLAKEIGGSIEVRCYGPFRRFILLAEVLYKIFSTGVLPLLVGKIGRKILRRGSATQAIPTQPGILISLDGEYSLDRSCRSVGFLVDYEKKLRPANYFVLGSGCQKGGAKTNISIAGYFDSGRLATALFDRRIGSGGMRLFGHGISAVLESLRCWSKPQDMAFVGEVGRLFLRAALFCELFDKYDIRCFLAADTYNLDSDSALVASKFTKTKTIAYQYSNLSFPNVIAISAWDVMLIFSEPYIKLWNYFGIRPKHFEVTGYPFDESFSYVEDRAREHRAVLVAAGAKFIICYYDENIGPEKYGFTHPDAYFSDLRLLARKVLEDPEIGVIFKSQFRRRSPILVMGGDPLFREALDTGRIIDLQSGVHRNTVLPAEAALASDVTISNLVGATAALESALCGTRSVLINPGGVETENDAAYAKNPYLVLPSLERALEEIETYRADSREENPLGDWTKVLEKLCLTSDGLAAERIRALTVAMAYDGVDAAVRPLQA